MLKEKSIQPSIKLSVLMTVYNCAEYLAASIESILNQSFKDFEFIIINNASPDKAADIIAHYASQDKRIKVITNKKNVSFGAVTKQAISEGTGEYLAFAHGDDIYRDDRLEKQTAALDRDKKIGAVLTRQTHTSDQLKYKAIDSTIINFNRDIDIKSNLLRNIRFPISSLMFRRDILGKNNISFTDKYGGADDIMFYINLAQHTKFFIVSQVLTYSRIHSKQDSNVNNDIVVEGHLEVIKIHLARFNIQADTELLKRFIFYKRYRGNLDKSMQKEITQLVKEIISISNFYDYSSPSLGFKLKCLKILWQLTGLRIFFSSLLKIYLHK